MTIVKHYIGLPDVEERVTAEYKQIISQTDGAVTIHVTDFDDFEFIDIEYLTPEIIEGTVSNNIRVDELKQPFNLVFNKCSTSAYAGVGMGTYILNGMEESFSFETFKNIKVENFELRERTPEEKVLVVFISATLNGVPFTGGLSYILLLQDQ